MYFQYYSRTDQHRTVPFTLASGNVWYQSGPPIFCTCNPSTSTHVHTHIGNWTGPNWLRMFLSMKHKQGLPLIRKYGSTSYVGMGLVQNCILYLRYRSNFVITKAEHFKTFTQKSLHYSIVETAPRLLLTFPKVEKIVHKNICLVQHLPLKKLVNPTKRKNTNQ